MTNAIEHDRNQLEVLVGDVIMGRLRNKVEMSRGKRRLLDRITVLLGLHCTLLEEFSDAFTCDASSDAPSNSFTYLSTFDSVEIVTDT